MIKYDKKNLWSGNLLLKIPSYFVVVTFVKTSQCDSFP